jgi:hypothetical protein
MQRRATLVAVCDELYIDVVLQGITTSIPLLHEAA